MRWLTAMVIGLGVLVGFFTWKNMSMPKTTGLVDGRLHPCPKKPNCVCCCHDEKINYIEPLPFSSKDTLDRIQAFLEQHYNAQVIQKTPDYLHIVVTSSVLHLKNDLEFALNRKKGVVLVRAAARVGYSDSDANRGRIETLRVFLANGS